MNHPLLARLVAAGLLLACASLAQAQYVWINEKGVKEFSDRSPPASIPLKNILKTPNGVPDAPSAAPEASAPKAAPSLAERNADYNKRQKDKADQEKKERDALELKAAQAENCERAHAARRSLDSGARIPRLDANGERGFMTDEQRAVESGKVDKALAACK